MLLGKKPFHEITPWNSRQVPEDGRHNKAMLRLDRPQTTWQHTAHNGVFPIVRSLGENHGPCHPDTHDLGDASVLMLGLGTVAAA